MYLSPRLVVCLATCMPWLVLAQDDPLPVIPLEQAAPVARNAAVGIEEIIVTAQKREQSINDVPIAISAFSGDTLAALGVTDTRDLGGLVPGLSANDSGNGTPIYTLRGVGFNETTYTATGTVGTYIDEIGLPYSVMTKGPSVDIERVEVLKGPQGTLYGRNTTGGLINQIAKKPDDTFEAGVNFGYARFDTIDTEAYVSGPLSEVVKARFAVRSINALQGWQYSNTRPDDKLGQKNKLSARGSMEWQARDDLFFRFAVEGWLDRSAPQAPQAVGFNPQNPFLGQAALAPEVRAYPLVPLHGADPQVGDWAPYQKWMRDDSFKLLSVKSLWNITDTLDLTTLLSGLRMQSDGSDNINSGVNQYVAESTTLAHINTGSLESRLSGAWGEAARWMVGVNASLDGGAERQFLKVDRNSALFPVEPEPTDPSMYRADYTNSITNRIETNGFSRIRQLAVFANNDWPFREGMNLNTGLRYTQNKEHFRGCSLETLDATGAGISNVFTTLSAINAAQYTAATGKPGRPTVVRKGECFTLKADGGTDPFEGDLNEANLSGRIALDYKPVEDALLFTSISRGFKAGGFPVVNASGQYQYTPTRQEELLAYEAGMKVSFFDRRLHANLSGFYYDYTDKQLLTKALDPYFGPLVVLRNAPKSHVYGLELDAQSTPANGLFLSLATSYIVTRIDEFTSTNSDGQQQDFAGRPFNFSPKVGATVMADYTVPISETLDLGAGSDYQYTGQTNGTLDGNPLYDLPVHQLIGARIHLADSEKRWSLALWGRNLTNQFYVTAAFNLGDTVARYAGLTRSYGLTFSYNFVR